MTGASPVCEQEEKEAMTQVTALVTDSTCNLYPELAVGRRIHIVPLYVLWGDHSYRDGVDLGERELFRRLATERELPKTSQATPQDFVDAFKQARVAEKAEAVVCGVLSSSLSGTYASAMQAREMVDFPVYVVDTRKVSWALGFTMLAAAEARDAGQTPQQIAQVIAETAERTQILFTIESLEYIHRGGRIGNASRLLGTALNIKPLLEIRDGIVNSVDKVRTRKRALERMLDLIEQIGNGRQIIRLAVIHGDVEAEAAALRDVAVARFQPRESYLSYAAAVLGVHVGPGTLGICVEYAP